MTSDKRFRTIATIGAIAAAAIVGGVLFALYPNNYGSGGATQTAQYSGGQTISNTNSNNTSTSAQNPYNTTNTPNNNSTATTAQQSGGSSAAPSSGY